MYNAYAKRKAATLAKIRPLILQRDGYRCIICGAVDRLHIAHYSPLADGLKGIIVLGKKRRGGNRIHKVEPQSWEELNSNNNLVTLCYSCHAIYDKRWWQVPLISEVDIQRESDSIERRISHYLFDLYPPEPIILVPYEQFHPCKISHYKWVGRYDKDLINTKRN